MGIGVYPWGGSNGRVLVTGDIKGGVGVVGVCVVGGSRTMGTVVGVVGVSLGWLMGMGGGGGGEGGRQPWGKEGLVQYSPWDWGL